MMAKVIVEVYGGVAYATYADEGTRVLIVDYDHLEHAPKDEVEKLEQLCETGQSSEARELYKRLIDGFEEGLYDAHPPANRTRFGIEA